jgi:acetyl/propionyl-CoA carboxylase alpha subunit
MEKLHTLLIANRGEIAVRSSPPDLGTTTTAQKR